MRRIGNLLLLLCAGTALGTLSLTLVYLLPAAPMQEHMRACIDSYVAEGDNPFVMEGYKGSSLDNYTDAIMLANAVYASEAPAWQAAMRVERWEKDGEQNQEALREYLTEGSSDRVSGYARYWHGYLMLLKPLLLVFNYPQIRMLNGIVMLVLTGLLFRGFRKRRMKRSMIAMLLALMSLFPAALPFSLQFSTAFYTGMTACLVVLYRYEAIEERDVWCGFFFLTGMLTSFFDFLTYPLFTFGMPIVLCLTLKRPGRREGLFFLTKAGAAWCAGYAGMWAGKWTVGSLLGGVNIWKDAVYTVGVRASSSAYEEHVSRILAVLRNFYIYFNPYGMLLWAILVVWVGAYLWRRRKEGWDSHTMLMLAIACLPILWYLAAANHSYVHYWYSFRNLAVSVFAAGMITETHSGRQ